MDTILSKIISHPRYQAGILYGSPRRGHSEGTIAAHIEQLLENLRIFKERGMVTDEEAMQLQIIAHVHDTFKGETAIKGKKNCPIEDPESHASLAREFLSQFTDDADMLAIVQYHDLGYALYRNMVEKGRLNEDRLESGLAQIKDCNLFLKFCLMDTCTPSKGREGLRWFIEAVQRRRHTEVSVEWVDLFPAPQAVEADVF